MSYETWSDADFTSLSSGYTAGSGSLVVTHSNGNNGGFPSAATFRVRIYDSAIPGVTKARLKVTAIPDSTHLTVVSDGLDANCNVGDIVENVLDSNGLLNILANAQQINTYANLPASGPFPGAVFKATDVGVDFRWNGSIWVPTGGPACQHVADVPPSSANAMDDEFFTSSLDAKWTQYGGGGGGQTITLASNSFLRITSPSTITQRVFGVYQTAPSGNFKIRCKAAFDAATFQYMAVGMFIRRSSVDKVLQGMLLSHNQEGYSYWINRLTANVWQNETDCYDIVTSTVYFEIEYDGTNYYFRTSMTGSDPYTEFWHETPANFLGATADQIGICIHAWGDGSTNPKMGLVGSFDWFRRIS